jgi:TonB family protein
MVEFGGARFMPLCFWYLYKQTVVRAVCIAGFVTASGAGSIFAQDTTPPKDACKIDGHLKTIKTLGPKISEENLLNGVEGSIRMCVTVNGEGKVADVRVLSGPPELRQSSVDAVKQWQFEPPLVAPATTEVEFANTLTKACPGGGDASDVGNVKVNIETGHTVEGETGDPLKIVGQVCQPQPPYPEKARAQRRRGQLYLSIAVNGNGDVVDAKIVMGLDELLDKPALDAVSKWKFKVAPPGGKTTVFRVILSFQIPCLDQPQTKPLVR